MKDTMIAVRVEKVTLAKLQSVAKKQDRAVSWLIRQAIDRLLKENRRAYKHSA